MRLSEVLKKERDGDPISNDELMLACEKLAMILSSPIGEMGEAYSLFVHSLRLTYYRFEGYAIARGLLHRRKVIGVDI